MESVVFRIKNIDHYNQNEKTVNVLDLKEKPIIRQNIDSLKENQHAVLMLDLSTSRVLWLAINSDINNGTKDIIVDYQSPDPGSYIILYYKQNSKISIENMMETLKEEEGEYYSDDISLNIPNFKEVARLTLNLV